MEWWSYEVCILISGIICVYTCRLACSLGCLSGILSTLDAATFVACFTLINVLYMVSLGFAISASVRVGQFLGADEPNNAKRTGKVAVILIGDRRKNNISAKYRTFYALSAVGNIRMPRSISRS